MHQHPFIFSNEPKYRIGRHVSFWLCWWIFSATLYSFSAPAMQIPYLQRFPLIAVESFFYLIPHSFLSYTLMYWAVPKLLLKERYVLTALAVILLFLLTAVISAVIGVYLLHYLRTEVLGEKYLPPPHQYNAMFYLALLAGLRGGITVGGMAAAIKLMKYWYVKEQRNLQLQRENMEARLALLKAQIHPHFLFNTMNNIYAHTINTTPTGSKLVMGLSDMLRYMLYEGNSPVVPLGKEIKMLRDYIMLEEIRYNHQLELNLDLPDDTQDLYIAPLLLLPFIENCFKHGTSQVLEHPWISLTLTIEGRQLKMKLMNGKRDGSAPGTGGIGISNVRNRLELLYPERHSLKISSTEDTFIVNLWVDLERITVLKEVQPASQHTHA